MTEPDAHHFINDLALALHGREMHARDNTPKEVWEELLDEVRNYSGVNHRSICALCGKPINRLNDVMRRRWIHDDTDKPECESPQATPLTSTSQHNDSDSRNK